MTFLQDFCQGSTHLMSVSLLGCTKTAMEFLADSAAAFELTLTLCGVARYLPPLQKCIRSPMLTTMVSWMGRALIHVPSSF